MTIANFTVPEIEYFRKNCNFVGDELLVFELRSRDVSLAEIAAILSITQDKAKKLSCKVNKKILKVI